jgi:hypothetical protein
MQASMKCLRIYSTADGESHFDQVEIDKLPVDSAVADEKRLQFNDELRRHSKLAVVFDLKEAGP